MPERGVAVTRTLLRDPDLCVAVLRSRGVAVDYSALTSAAAFRAAARRPQLAVVLAGRGYLETPGRMVELGPGDVVLSDQSSTRAEGYGGSPCAIVIVEWDAARPAAPQVGRASRRDVERLRALSDRVEATPPRAWLAQLGAVLGAIGGTLDRDLEPRAGAPAPAPLARAYAALGDALSHLDGHPSLADVAASLSLGERQVNRLLGELARAYGHPFGGWRDFVNEMRLDWATHLLSIPRLPLDRVARLAGYRSTIALSHAFSRRGAPPPGVIAKMLAERWA